MTAAEIAAYRQGVADVIALACRVADTMETRSRRPVHEAFAVEALRALADEAEALAKPAASTPESSR